MRAEPKAHALEESLRAWGLRAAPFCAAAKDAGLFPGAGQREALALLETTAALRGVMVLTGAAGTGKSALARTWAEGLEPKRFLPLLITQSSLSATGVLEMLLAKLGERPRFKRSGNLLALEKHLADLDPITLVLLLDDAQNYPAPALEEIRLLLGLGGRARSAFALVLIGDEYLLGSLRLSVLSNLARKHTAAAINAACARAIEAGTHRLRDVRRLLEATALQPPLAFADTHPLIRDLGVYSRFVENHQPALHHEPPDPQTVCPRPAPLGAA